MDGSFPSDCFAIIRSKRSGLLTVFHGEDDISFLKTWHGDLQSYVESLGLTSNVETEKKSIFTKPDLDEKSQKRIAEFLDALKQYV